MTSADASSHIFDVYERFVESKEITVLGEDEFCYIRNPKDEKG